MSHILCVFFKFLDFIEPPVGGKKGIGTNWGLQEDFHFAVVEKRNMVTGKTRYVHTLQNMFRDVSERPCRNSAVPSINLVAA